MASIELRKRIPLFYTQLPPNTQLQIKTALINSIQQHPSLKVRHALCRVVSEVATVELALNNWPELLPTLFMLCASETPELREVGTFLILVCFDSICDYVSDQVSQVMGAMSICIRDSNFDVW